MSIMHDFMEDIDDLIGAEIEQLVDHIDGHIDTCAETTGIGEKDLHEHRIIAIRPSFVGVAYGFK